MEVQSVTTPSQSGKTVVIDGEEIQPVIPHSDDSSSSESLSFDEADAGQNEKQEIHDSINATPGAPSLSQGTPNDTEEPLVPKGTVTTTPAVRKRKIIAGDNLRRSHTVDRRQTAPTPEVLSWSAIGTMVWRKLPAISFDIIFKCVMVFAILGIGWRINTPQVMIVPPESNPPRHHNLQPPPSRPTTSAPVAPVGQDPSILSHMLETIYKDQGLFGSLKEETFALVTRLEFIKSARHFVRGYARMKHVCTEISKLVGLESVAMVNSNDGERFNDTLYVSSASVYGPYFCLNLPSFILTEKAFSPDAALHKLSADAKQPLDLWRNIQIEWSRTTSTGLLAAHTINKRDLFAQSPIHARALVLYFERSFYARDLEKLGKDYKPMLVTQTVVYDSFTNQEALELQKPVVSEDGTEVTEKPRCICGPHLNMARHIVLYMDKHNPGGRLFIEPIITHRTGASTSIEVSVLPWAAAAKKGVDADKDSKYHAVDLDLRTETGFLRFQCSKEIAIDVVKLTRLNALEARALDGGLPLSGLGTHKTLSFYNQGERKVEGTLTGPEAQCIQYCEALAYAIRDRASGLAPVEKLIP